MDSQSCGQQLFHNTKLKQACYFYGNLIGNDLKIKWLNSLPKSELREKIKKFKDSSLCIVISQDCDIACTKDENEDSIEIALCQQIKPKDVFEGNQFVKSVRKFQFIAQEKNYEAHVDYILTVKKNELLNVLGGAPNDSIFTLDPEYKLALPYWRSNRYLRSALPDNFNNAISPIIKDFIPKLNEKADVDKGKYDFSSFIKAFYININSLEEEITYDFEFFFLLRDEISNSLLSEIQDIVENMADSFAETSGFSDKSDIFVGKESNTTIGYLSNLIRFNVDHFSLRKGEDDFSIDC